MVSGKWVLRRRFFFQYVHVPLPWWNDVYILYIHSWLSWRTTSSDKKWGEQVFWATPPEDQESYSKMCMCLKLKVTLLKIFHFKGSLQNLEILITTQIYQQTNHFSKRRSSIRALRVRSKNSDHDVRSAPPVGFFELGSLTTCGSHIFRI